AIGLILVVMALPEILGGALPGLARLQRTSLAARRSLGSETGVEPVSAVSERPDGQVTHPPCKAVLRFIDVSFRYPGALRNVLEDVSLEFAHGQVVAIAGRSGCGKSTLAALASRLRVPDAGRIELMGRNLGEVDESQLRHSVTVLSQRSYIFNDTVAANLRIANPTAGDSELWSALDKAALAERISRYPEGLQTVLGEEGLGLSGGEQRRLALARAFLTVPDLFILDEMTEGLDEATAGDVLARFLEFRQQAAVLMIAHRKLELDVADRVVGLRDTVAASN
ncbi:MAG: ATP-binding cassette domain-containing protein, partial [Roseibium sp.]|uniref:ATP-binding cassette domain-containing protein n=1 Tax=Roseibium sp. TaxID=1936156 RepID=UPI0026048A41